MCHGMPHLHCHSLTNLCRWQSLHQVRSLSLLVSNFVLVPSTACLHVGQCSRMMSGSLTWLLGVLVVSSISVVLRSGWVLLMVTVSLVCAAWCIWVCIAFGWKGPPGHSLRLSIHLALPLVLSLCWIIHCRCWSFCVAALYEQLACDCMILVVNSVSAAGVSGMDIGKVAK